MYYATFIIIDGELIFLNFIGDAQLSINIRNNVL